MHADTHHPHRREAILRILRGSPVRKQDELVRLLREAGHDVTQSSVSRDLRELGVLKAGGRYLPPSEESSRFSPDGAPNHDWCRPKRRDRHRQSGLA